MRWDRTPELNNVRDAAMAANLLWLLRERHAGHKIMAFTANFHAMRDVSSLDTETRHFGAFVPMGQILSRELGDRMVVIASVAYATAGAEPEDRFEELLHRAGAPRLLIDLRALGAERSRFKAGFLGYTPFEATWSRVFDAAVFTNQGPG